MTALTTLPHYKRNGAAGANECCVSNSRDCARPLCPASVVSDLAAANVRSRFPSKPCLRMTGLTAVAETPSITCRECKRMLRQQHAQTSMSGKSAQPTLPFNTMTVRAGSEMPQGSARFAWERPSKRLERSASTDASGRALPRASKAPAPFSNHPGKSCFMFTAGLGRLKRA